MKIWYALFLIFFIVGCDKDDKEPDFKEIEIEKHYSFFYQTKEVANIDENTLKLFYYKVYLINSIEDLNKSPLFEYCSENLKEELRKCNFEEYTLLITGSYEDYELISLESNLRYNNFSSEYVYYQNLLCKASEKPLDKIYLIFDIFSIKKIPENSKFSFTKKLGLQNL